MARKSARLVLNMAALNAVEQALGHGVAALAQEIAADASARAPDATPFGVGLKRSWGISVWANGKKIADASGDGKATAKPRAHRAGKGLTAIVGFGFPGRFQEFGTAHHRAQPFLTPAMESKRGMAATLIRAGAAPHMPR